MRRTLLTGAATLTLAAGALVPTPATAAANNYVISGHPITAASGMLLVGDSCGGGGQPTVTELERQGGTAGSGALGWRVNQADSEAGPAIELPGDPATLSAARVDVYAPTGTTGHVYAWFPETPTSYWVGWRSFSVPAGQWIQNDLTNVTYTWSLYSNGEWVSDTDSRWTIQDWADGAGATVARVGVLLGCGGEDFYVDRMFAANAQNSASYDFEPKPTPPPPPPPPPHEHHKAHLEWMTADEVIRNSDSVTIRHGQSLWMLGHAHVHSDVGNIWYTGVGSLYETPARGTRRLVLNGKFTPTQYAALKVKPKTNTIYEFSVDAHDNHPATESELVEVWVQSKVTADVVDKRLVQGQKLAVKGRIFPAAKRVQVTLQRKVGGRWKKLASSQTTKGGWFDIATPARQPGTWKVRVRVATTGANIGTTTRTAKVTVKKYVPPRKNQPPPPPPVDSTPEVSTQVSTQQPTQVQDTAPQPPDRPLNTGRVAAATAVAGGSVKGEAPTKP
jgi:hypothetical protein